MLDIDRHDVEEIILCMADIVEENRELRSRLKNEMSYEKKYNDLLSKNLKAAQQGDRELLNAIMSGCFTRRMD